MSILRSQLPLLLVSFAFAATATTNLHAQGASNKAAAEALFEEGRRLIAESRAAEACPKFAESQRLDASVGTQLNLANCYEVTGKTASAWVTFKEAASAASAQNRADYVATAQKRAAALAPKLSKLVITASSDVAVSRDGVALDRAQIGVPIPVDPGAHTIEATASGKKAWKTTVDVSGNAASVSVAVPTLEDAPVEKPVATVAPPPPPPPTTSVAPPPPPTEPATGNGQRTAGYVVGAVGIVGIGLGTFFALSARSKYKDSLQMCSSTDKNLCSADGVSKRDDARSAGNIATIAGGIGAAALVGGVVLVLTAPSSSSSPTASARVELLPSLGGATIRGAW